jgi:hypothetical protein
MNYPALSRDVRVVRGLHGLQLYANESWVDYMTSIFPVTGDLADNQVLWKAAGDLSDRLLTVVPRPSDHQISVGDSAMTEDCRSHMQRFEGLYEQACRNLAKRTLKDTKYVLEGRGAFS